MNTKDEMIAALEGENKNLKAELQRLEQIPTERAKTEKKTEVDTNIDFTIL